MVDLPAHGWLGLGTCANRDDVLGLALDAIGIAQHEAALVVGPGFEIEDAACEHVGGDELKRVFVDALVIQAQQRKSWLPGLVAFFAIRDRDRGIVVVVPVDLPFKSERDKGGAFGDEFFGGDLRGGRQPQGPQ